jgi:hypothetical protein
MTSVPIVATLCYTLTPVSIVAQQRVPTMTPGHVSCLVSRETQQTDIDGLMRCSSLTLEREEHRMGPSKSVYVFFAL